MSKEENDKFIKLMAEDANDRQNNFKEISKKLRENDEYEIVKLY